MEPESGSSPNQSSEEQSTPFNDPVHSNGSLRLVAIYILTSAIFNVILLVLAGSFPGIYLINLVIQAALSYGLFREIKNIRGITQMYLVYNAVMLLYFAYKGMIAGYSLLFVITQYSLLTAAYLPVQGSPSLLKNRISMAFFSIYVLLGLFGLTQIGR